MKLWPFFFLGAAIAIASCTAIGPGSQASVHSTNRITPAVDCHAWTGAYRNSDVPGYLTASPGGKVQCVPVLQTAIKRPKGYPGDFYVDEFTDAKLKQRWTACKLDSTCRARIEALMQRWLPPNKKSGAPATGLIDPLSSIDPDRDVDLMQIRRPGFFGKAPYFEPVAEAEPRTYVV